MQKFIPILYSTEMVQALRAGRKTMTRRTKGLERFNINPDAFTCNNGMKSSNRFYHEGEPSPNPIEVWHLLQSADGHQNEIKCPYGKVGDIHWVRESFLWCCDDSFLEGMDSRLVFKADVHPDWFEAYKEKYPHEKWNPSIHMPKNCCRLFLKITGIRLERLQMITDDDAMAEGIQVVNDGITYHDYMCPKVGSFVRAHSSFLSLWEKIRGYISIKENYWVWVITFEKTDKPQNFI